MFGVRRRTNPRSLIGQNTNRGVRGKRNDDRCDHFLVNLAGKGELQVLVVADGVTSAEGSAQASEIAIREVKAFLSQPRNIEEHNAPVLQWLNDAIVHAHQQILRVSQIYPEWRAMCTTIVLAIIYEHKLYVAHMGDSRAYLLRSNSIQLLTRDHTWIQDAVDDGLISALVAKTHPKRHIVKRFLGIQEHIQVDCSIIEPHFEPTANGHSRRPLNFVELESGDAVLLCTDGLTGKIEDEEIKQKIFQYYSRPQKAVDALIKLALKRKETDNITALLFKFPAR